MHPLLPRRPSGHLGALGVDVVPVELTAAGVDIDLGSPEPSLALPKVTDNPEEGNDEKGHIRLEEVLSSTETLADGGNGSVELGSC